MKYTLEIELDGAMPPNSRNLATMVMLGLDRAMEASGHSRDKWDIRSVHVPEVGHEPTVAELSLAAAF